MFNKYFLTVFLLLTGITGIHAVGDQASFIQAHAEINEKMCRLSTALRNMPRESSGTAADPVAANFALAQAIRDLIRTWNQVASLARGIDEPKVAEAATIAANDANNADIAMLEFIILHFFVAQHEVSTELSGNTAITAAEYFSAFNCTNREAYEQLIDLLQRRFGIVDLPPLPQLQISC